jgi:hypothetical protein
MVFFLPVTDMIENVMYLQNYNLLKFILTKGL